MERLFNKEDLINVFVRYAKENSQSDASKKQRPTTSCQIDLLKLIEKDIVELGITNTEILDNRRLKVFIKGNIDAPTIAFMAHIDTASDVKGNFVKPIVWRNYNGEDIILPNKRVIDVDTHPYLKDYKGSEIITSSGDTLLGGDDKAGVSAMFILIKTLANNPSIKHGNLEFWFTTDEETGYGMENFPIEKTNARVAYTLDGGPRYEIEQECFNAAACYLTVKGVPAHYGAAKNILVNSITSLMKIINSLPQSESPETTENKEGYYVVSGISGNSEEAKAIINIRDFDSENFEKRIKNVKSIAKSIDAITKSKTKVKVVYQYYNMLDYINKDPLVMESLLESAKNIGQKSIIRSIRGGTDGSHLSKLGVPTPNIYTGSYSIHSYKEHLVVDILCECIDYCFSIIDWWIGK